MCQLQDKNYFLSEIEKDFIRENVGHLSVLEMSEQMGRSTECVYYRIKKEELESSVLIEMRALIFLAETTDIPSIKKSCKDRLFVLSGIEKYNVWGAKTLREINI